MNSIANFSAGGPAGDNTIDWTAVVGSAGDGSPAMWRVVDPAKPPVYQTTLQISSRPTADKKARRVNIEALAFYGTTVGGVFTPTGRFPVKAEVVVPLTVDSGIAAGYVKAMLCAISDDVVVASVGAGYAPR